MPQIADILLTLGDSYTSDLIGRATRETIEAPAVSHAALFIAREPLLIIESIPPRARVCTYETALKNVKHAILVSPKNLTQETRLGIAKKALDFEGALYGFDRYIGALADAVLDKDWASEHLFLSKRFPYCSVLVSATYDAFGLDFGEPAQGVNPAEILTFAVRHPDIYRWKYVK